MIPPERVKIGMRVRLALDYKGGVCRGTLPRFHRGFVVYLSNSIGVIHRKDNHRKDAFWFKWDGESEDVSYVYAPEIEEVVSK
jgi:hypothetical protein